MNINNSSWKVLILLCKTIWRNTMWHRVFISFTHYYGASTEQLNFSPVYWNFYAHNHECIVNGFSLSSFWETQKEYTFYWLVAVVLYSVNACRNPIQFIMNQSKSVFTGTTLFVLNAHGHISSTRSEFSRSEKNREKKCHFYRWSSCCNVQCKFHSHWLLLISPSKVKNINVGHIHSSLSPGFLPFIVIFYRSNVSRCSEFNAFSRSFVWCAPFRSNPVP